MRWSKKVGVNYEKLFDDCRTKASRKGYVNKAAAKAMKNKKKYTRVAKQIGCPWEFIAAIHMRESNADFRGVLHNGERIIGTGRKTKLVPKNQGPFDTWEEAAIHSLRRMKIHRIKDWSNGRLCFELEKYNGWGYQGRSKSKRSPYLWAGTNKQKAGKYVADGKYSSKAWDKQLGAVPVLKRIRALDVPTKVVVRSSRRLTLGKRIRQFIEWSGVAGVGGLLTFDNLQRVVDFVTDEKTLIVLCGAGIVYLILKISEFQTVREFKQGRYEPSAMYHNEQDESETEYEE